MKKSLALAAIVFLSLTGCSAPSATQTGDSSPAAEPAASEPAAPAETTAPAEPAAPEEPALTAAQQNAVRSAENYLSLTGFSRDGLIAQLEFEDYSTEDATLAVDSLTVDWNAEAAEKAQAYQDVTPFSRQGLIDQLIFDKFTPEQAEFGATAVGL